MTSPLDIGGYLAEHGAMFLVRRHRELTGEGATAWQPDQPESA
jgi:hypothetical protein